MNKADLSGIVSSSRKPNMMQFLFKLTEEIDCEVMHNAMQKALRRLLFTADLCRDK